MTVRFTVRLSHLLCIDFMAITFKYCSSLRSKLPPIKIFWQKKIYYSLINFRYVGFLFRFLYLINSINLTDIKYTRMTYQMNVNCIAGRCNLLLFLPFDVTGILKLDFQKPLVYPISPKYLLTFSHECN